MTRAFVARKGAIGHAKAAINWKQARTTRLLLRLLQERLGVGLSGFRACSRRSPVAMVWIGKFYSDPDGASAGHHRAGVFGAAIVLAFVLDAVKVTMCRRLAVA